MSKTVYILGAGFSIDAGAPTQNKIIKEIFKLAKEHPSELDLDSVEIFRNFLSNILSIPERLHAKIPLEDVFTPLDRCLTDNISFRDISIQEVKNIRQIVYYLIGKTLEFLLRTSGSKKNYIDLFAKKIVQDCSIRKGGNYRNIDPISIISTNWDILLDVSLSDAINYPSYPHGEAVVDYCCHISSYLKHDESVKPGLEILGKGGFNIKYLKLHGSLNWLQCPRCLRNYVDMRDKIATRQYDLKERCRHCDGHFGDNNSHILVSNLVMPTFLKDFSNPQYKLIWQNAGIELSEAKKIVFIGYSLPQADFEMRQLLSRMVRNDAEIEVVTGGSGPGDTNVIETTERYEVFFGERLIKPIYWRGAQQYIIDNFS